jgi:cytochrome c peroxidase
VSEHRLDRHSARYIPANVMGRLLEAAISRSDPRRQRGLRAASIAAAWLSGDARGLAQSRAAASGTQFRTAPLWGIGQRIFFLHDGRTNSLVTAIEQHASSGSEANEVIENFNMLSTSQQQALINFLRSL